MASSSNKIKQPESDPYMVLGLDFPVTDDAAVTKAYRKLALQLHPDKQAGATPAQAEAVAAQFHQVQLARAFLLDAEFAASRQAYDRQRASQQARQAHEQAQRDKLSNHRKRMQQELAEAEAAAAAAKQSKKPKRASTASSRHREEELRRQGQAMREQHAAAAAQERYEQQASAASNKAARQVRLKWSRKRVKTSPSEDSLARNFKKFGPVESVEMLGTKGNAALITFQHASSCRPCVEFYQSSNEMRATYIQDPPESSTAGVAKDSTTARQAAASEATSSTNARDYESVAEWQARRAAAREAFAQQEQDENVQSSATATKRSGTFSIDFLPKFPATADPSLTYWQQLTALEEQILAPILGAERMKAEGYSKSAKES